MTLNPVLRSPAAAAEAAAVARLDSLDPSDPERSHLDADATVLELLRAVGLDDAADAYEAARGRCLWWHS